MKKLSDAELALYGSSLITLILVVGFFFPLMSDAPVLRVISWVLIIIFMILFVVLLGLRISGRHAGVFINERYKMSLSRFQLVVWTIIVLSAFVTIALGRIQAYAVDPSYFADPLIADPLAIGLPSQLWALLGISTASLVGSPLVLSTKKPKTPTPLAVVRAAKIASTKEDVSTEKIVEAAKTNYDQVLISSTDIRIRRSAEENWKKAIVTAQQGRIPKLIDTYNENIQVQGTLSSNTDPSKAEFSEIFRGDEIGNQNVIDMAKVQMFFFTILIVFSYAVLLMMLLWTQEPAAIDEFPELTEATVALLGISSGGYLANKTTDKTKTV